MEDGLESAKLIFERLKNPITLLYFEFLNFVLSFFTDLNLEMQSSSVKIQVVYDRLASLYKEILNCYIKNDYTRNKGVHAIQYRNPEFYLDLDNIYLGAKVIALLTTMVTENKILHNAINDFKLKCQCFYVEAAKQVYQRFPFRRLQPLKHFEIINSQNIFDGNVPSIGPMYGKLPNLFGNIEDINDLDREWRKLFH